jgi:hypothetical protein
LVKRNPGEAESNDPITSGRFLREDLARQYRASVGQLDGGSVLEAALKYRDVASKTPRHNR